MATIGEELKQVEDDKTRERIARRSNMLRKFVKEDLLLALRLRISEGYTDYAPVLPPKEIRRLFAAGLDYSGVAARDRKDSAYYDVWKELDEWAAGEDLSISTGINLSKDNYIRPWDDYDWGGTLRIRKPEPVKPTKPTPPASQKIQKGATISVNEALWGLGFAVLVTFLITFFAMRP